MNPRKHESADSTMKFVTMPDMDLHGFDLYRDKIPPEIIREVPFSVAREARVIPIKMNGSALLAAISDVDDRETIAMLRFVVAREIEVGYASREAIEFALAKYYPGADPEPDGFTETSL